MPHPKVIGIIKECGAKMHLRESKLANFQTSELT
jgi:hypothetical protein